MICFLNLRNKFPILYHSHFNIYIRKIILNGQKYNNINRFLFLKRRTYFFHFFKSILFSQSIIIYFPRLKEYAKMIKIINF